MSNEWQNGICGCCSDCETCCMSYFCHCVVAGKNAEAVGQSCALYGCLSLFNCIGICTRAIIRQKLREKYAIQGGLVSDIFFHWCCPVCALAQERNEIKVHGGAPAGMAMARS